jgi:hypothetical protein
LKLVEISRNRWAVLTQRNKIAIITSDLEDRRRQMEDADAKRDAQRQMTWFALSGMVLYPLAILGASVAGLSTAAELIADIANIYVVSVSALVGAYFGFNAMGAKK